MSVYLPKHYRFECEILRKRDNGNYDILVNNIEVGNVEPRYLEFK
ncbi:hypothetical protein [Acinetobacter phage ABPH49]|nr:hypothetical protein [Acinetobacter phage ABPH49]